jgi:hypothetical protein
MPNVASTYTFNVGWASVMKSVAVVTDVCAPACEAWQECVISSSGATCGDLGLMLTWVSPTEGQPMGPAPAASLGLSLSVTRQDGGVFNGTVPFALDGGAAGLLAKSGPAWTATIDAGIADGPRQLIAGWQGGPGAVRNFVVVASAPTVTLYPQDGVDTVDRDAAKRWKKSDVAKVQVESNRALVSLAETDFVNSGVSPGAGCTRNCTPGATCACFDVDLSVQPYVQTTGEVFGTVDVALKTLVDTYGNSTAVIPTQQFKVTRLKWVKQVAGAGTLPTALAVSASGLVVAGGHVATGSTLVAIPPDGGTGWTQSKADFTAGPVVGQLGVYVAYATPVPNAAIAQYDFGGQPRPTPEVCVSATPYVGDLALVQPGANETAVAVRGDNRLAIGNSASGDVTTAIGGLSGTPTLIASGTDVYLSGNTSTSLWKYSNVVLSWSLSGSSALTTFNVANLFESGGIVGGGAASAGSGAFFAIAEGPSMPTNATLSSASNSPSGPAVVGPGSEVFAGDNASRLSKRTLSAGPTYSGPTPVTLSTSRFGAAAPLVGEGGLAYILGHDGILHVVDTAMMAEKWSWANGGIPTTGLSQLNIDLNRDVLDPCKAGQPGVLYFAASSASSTKVYALLVDSQGLPRNAAWPRYQHDPGNTGNAATDLTPWSCR